MPAGSVNNDCVCPSYVLTISVLPLITCMHTPACRAGRSDPELGPLALNKELWHPIHPYEYRNSTYDTYVIRLGGRERIGIWSFLHVKWLAIHILDLMHRIHLPVYRLHITTSGSHLVSIWYLAHHTLSQVVGDSSIYKWIISL